MLGKYSRVVLALFLFFALPTAALASQWVASKVAQPASYTVDNKNWYKIKRGMTIPKRSWIHTGGRGRLILRRGEEMIMYRPNTLAYLRSSQANGRKTHIQQQYGSLLLDLETRKHKHVTVKTPLLAAVVKGTRFEVVVGKKSAKVSVKRGVVGVISNSSGSSVDITSGQSAAVSSSSSDQVAVSNVGTSFFSRLVQATTTVTNPASANAASHSNANGKGNGNANGSANGNANGSANGNANGSANGNANGGANGGSNGNANGSANGNANGSANGNANGSANGNANGNGNGNGNGN